MNGTMNAMKTDFRRADPMQERPVWADPGTIMCAPDLETLYNWRAQLYACRSHPRTEVRYKVASNGQISFAAQCVDCGGKAGPLLKQDDWPARRIPWDAEWPRATREAYETRTAELREIEARDRYRDYTNYLQSDAWRQIRRRVLERDKYLCQACLQARATEVHHVTYDNLFKEFAFELKSVCRACHERIHEGRKNREAA